MPSPAAVLLPPIDFPPYRLDLRAGQLSRDGTPVRLRPKTFAVLHHLAERPGELVTKQALLDAVWGDGRLPTANTVDRYVAYLRRKLGPPPLIHTVRGVGFVLRG
jgi:DNA-binding response OmpR family regulator